MKDHRASLFIFLSVLFCKAAQGFVFLHHHKIRNERTFTNSYYLTRDGLQHKFCYDQVCRQHGHRHVASRIEALALKAHDEDFSHSTILDNSKNRTKWMYYLLAFLNGSIVSLLVSMPNRVLQSRNIQPSRYNASFVGGVYGHTIASVTSFILSFYCHNDSEHNISENEKNIKTGVDNDQVLLHWGLLSFSLVGLFAIPGEAAFHANHKSALILFMYISIVKLTGFIFSFNSLMKATSNSNNNLIQKMVSTMKYTSGEVMGIVRCKPKNKDAKIYQVLHQIVFYISLGNNLLCILQPQNSYLHKVSVRHNANFCNVYIFEHEDHESKLLFSTSQLITSRILQGFNSTKVYMFRHQLG